MESYTEAILNNENENKKPEWVGGKKAKTSSHLRAPILRMLFQTLNGKDARLTKRSNPLCGQSKSD